MKKNLLMCAIFAHATCFSVADSHSTYVSRQKRQDDGDRWIWGHDDVNVRMKEETSTSNPCSPGPPVPDFSAPGRRVSEVKCMEYIYDIKARAEEEKRSKACRQYQLEQSDMNTPPIVSVIGGRTASPGEYPHMGAVGWQASAGSWIFKCGCSLISNKFCLTAAHCSKASERDTSVADVNPKIVRLGDRSIIDSYDEDVGFYPVTANIIRVIEHSEYKAPKKYFDIALLELKDNVIFTEFVQPACLYTGPDYSLVGQSASITGWGVVETAGRTTSPVLQTADVNVLDSEQCDSILRPSCNRHWCGMQDHQLCAGKLEGGVDACQGDSGGPLQINTTLPSGTNGVMHHIIGVTSFGIGCAKAGYPGIYTRVSSFVDWIENIVWV